MNAAVVVMLILAVTYFSTSSASASVSSSESGGEEIPLASDGSPLQDPVTMTVSSVSNFAIDILAEGIAKAEGYGANASNFPTRNNNPGDLTADLIGKAIGFDQGKAIFANSADGWDNLKQQLRTIASGRSRAYSLAMSFQQFAAVWTGGDNPGAWLNTVLATVGMSGDATLADYFGVNA